MHLIPITRQSFYTSLIVSLVSVVVLVACSKKEEPLSLKERNMQYLVGMGNRYWRLKEVYLNGVKMPLTSAQLTYYKTYTISLRPTDPENSGTFTDADGFRGSWILDEPTLLKETIENAPGGPVPLIITIKDIGPGTLDEEYTFNGQLNRMVFFAY